MPIYGAVASLTDLILEDDEDDADTVVRKYFGEGWFKGPLVDALGVDFSKRVRLNSLLFEANRYTRDPSIEESIFYHIGGVLERGWSVRLTTSLREIYSVV